jgi:hypothetical protein
MERRAGIILPLIILGAEDSPIEERSRCKKIMKGIGSVTKNLVILQNHRKPSQLGELIVIFNLKIVHKDTNYNLKVQGLNFCNETV